VSFFALSDAFQTLETAKKLLFLSAGSWRPQAYYDSTTDHRSMSA